LKKFDVHLFEVFRVKVRNVEAKDAEQACIMARDGFEPQELLTMHAVDAGAEYADETSHYLAVPAGSKESGENDQWFLATKHGPVPVTLAQLNGMDDFILDIVLPMKDWEVPVTRTGYGSRRIPVKARTAEEAKRLAEDEAGGHEFSEHTSDYECDEPVDMTEE
jgi:hypothetical protein